MVLYTDATHVKANANTGKYDLAMIEKSRSDSWVDFGRAIDTERALHDQKPLKEKDREPEVKEAKVSRSGPDCAYMVRDGKPKGFFYLDHRLGDGKHANITDTHATPANVHGSIVYLEQLDRQRQRFGLNVGAFGLDAGYATSGIAHGVKERQILGITGYRNPTPRKPGMMSKSKFVHDREQDGYRGLKGHLLAYATTDRNGYRHYRSTLPSAATVQVSPPCTTHAKAQRAIKRHVWADARERSMPIA
jgi:hypothetical protein